jgi:hypothetical protein
MENVIMQRIHTSTQKQEKKGKGLFLGERHVWGNCG